MRPGGVEIVLGVGPEPIEVSSRDLIFGTRRLEGALTGPPAVGDATLRFSVLTGVAAMIETVPLEEALGGIRQDAGWESTFSHGYFDDGRVQQSKAHDPRGGGAVMSTVQAVTTFRTVFEQQKRHLPVGHKAVRVAYRATRSCTAIPTGVALIIGPFNGPLLLLLKPAITALAAGNCCVLKLSMALKATSSLLLDLVPKYFNPEAMLNRGPGRRVDWHRSQVSTKPSRRTVSLPLSKSTVST